DPEGLDSCLTSTANTCMDVIDTAGNVATNPAPGGCYTVFIDGTYAGSTCSGSGGGDSSSGFGTLPQVNPTPPVSKPPTRPRGYKNSFVIDAIKMGGLSVGFDMVGLVPEAEGFIKAFEKTAGYRIARAVGNSAGYRGVVATQYGMRAVAQGKGAVG